MSWRTFGQIALLIIIYWAASYGVAVLHEQRNHRAVAAETNAIAEMQAEANQAIEQARAAADEAVAEAARDRASGE